MNSTLTTRDLKGGFERRFDGGEKDGFVSQKNSAAGSHRFCMAAFEGAQPGPPSFSSMNLTPANSKDSPKRRFRSSREIGFVPQK